MHSKNTVFSNPQNRLLESISNIQNDFIKRGISYGWCKDTLENLLYLSESEFGFICEFLKKEDGTPYIKSHGITNIAWNEQTRQFYEENKERGLEFFNFESLWGKAITTGEPVIANDPDNDNRRGGYPKEHGHPILESFLALPIKGSDGEVLGVMGVANRQKGYDDNIVNFLSPFVTNYGVLIEKSRSDQQRKMLEIEREKLISDLKQSTEALQKSKALLDATGRMARVGGWELDANTHEVTWTDATYRIHEVPKGYKPPLQEAINFFHPEDRPKLEKAIQRALGHGEPYDLVIRFITAKGKHLWTRTQCEPKIVNGKVVKLKGIFQDITDRKQAEEKRQEGFNLLTNLARLVPGVIYQYRLYPDGHSAFPYSSPGMYDIYEVTPEEVREDASVVFGRLHPEDHDRVAEAIFESARTLNTFSCELRVILPEKGLGWRWSQAHPERTEDGGTLWHGIIIDITERKQAEQALREQEERLRAIFESTQDAIFLKDKDLRYTHCNTAMEGMFGRDCESIIGHIDADLFQTDNAEEIAAADRQVLEGHPYRGTLTLIIKGEKRIIDISKAPVFDSAGNVAGLCGVSRDITEEVELRDQMSQVQKIESVGRLAGGVAHDFNNMLGVILGHTELALLKADESHELHDDLKEIQKAAKRSADITRQLLAFARKQTISLRQLDLNDTVESMLNMLSRLIGEDIDLVWQPAAQIWPVKMDPSQIDQILANLCINARDAIAGVGKLTIETGIKSFDDEYCKQHAGFIPGDYVMLAVSDNGCGMDKDTLANLFEPFFTTKEVGKGTGLGLATVYGIVKQNNGFINVYSEPGHGSTFRIYLSRFFTDEDTDKVTPEKKATAGGTETILLVEDEPSILRMTQMMLERKGYTVLSDTSPAEAIEKAKNHSGGIDLLMTDVVMPEMNGRELAEKITNFYPNVRLLFMSGYTSNVIAHRGILDDGVAFIQKPFSMVDLAEKVRDVLEIV